MPYIWNNLRIIPHTTKDWGLTGQKAALHNMTQWSFCEETWKSQQGILVGKVASCKLGCMNSSSQKPREASLPCCLALAIAAAGALSCLGFSSARVKKGHHHGKGLENNKQGEAESSENHRMS